MGYITVYKNSSEILDPELAYDKNFCVRTHIIVNSTPDQQLIP